MANTIFSGLFIFIIILLGLGIIALMAPVTNDIYHDAATNAGMTGIEKLVYENVNLWFFLIGGSAVFLLFSTGGGDET